ncbi:hypothetical protein Alsa1_CDS0180 [Staphylococcus phage Alsa_1]|nr:hypothetical protein Alsa1_CDS0180 [Staphylococcus phage Alsa_1]
MSFQVLLSGELNRFNYKKPTDKQLDYIKTLQKRADYKEYTKAQLKQLSQKEISKYIDKLNDIILDDELQNECYSAGLPNY